MPFKDRHVVHLIYMTQIQRSSLSSASWFNKTRHPCTFGDDRSSINLAIAIKVHMLQNIKPAPKTLTSSSI